jgi:hypothetical protein
METSKTPVTLEQWVKIDYCLRCPFLYLDKTPAYCVTGESPGPSCSFNGDPVSHEWD